MEHKKRFLILTAVVVVLIVLALGLALWKNVSPQRKTGSSTVVSAVSPNQLPAGFPVNVPFEQGALVVSNFNAVTQNGQLQATRTFKSLKTIGQNIILYANFLAKPGNGWTVIASSTDQSGDRIMVAKSGQGLLSVRVSPLPPQPMPASLVEITYVSNPPYRAARPAATSSSAVSSSK
jgi:hypothetical protein